MNEIELTVDELDSIIDEIISEGIVSGIDDDLIESILYGEDEINEDMSSAVNEFLKKFDKKASIAIEKKSLNALAKKHKVDPEELLKVVGV